jgi:dihydroorotase
VPDNYRRLTGVLMKLSGDSRDFILRGGRVIDPAQGLDGISDVLILDGLIADINPHIEIGKDRSTQVREIDAGSKWIVPGLIDMHVHLREPGEEYKETIATGTRAAVAGGFTAVACMPNTHPVNDCASVTQYILEKAREEGACRVFPVGAISRGLEGKNLAEYGELHESGAVAVSDDGRPVMNSLLMRRALEYARTFDLLVISHCEDIDLSAGGLMNEGPISTRLGMRGIPGAAEEVMIARDLFLSQLTGSRIHIAHISTARSVALVREAKAKGIPVTAETAPHYFTLTDELITTFDPVYKVNPPLRSSGDVEAIKAGLADGTIDAIASDHAPHSAVEKDLEFEFASNGMIGLESSLPLILKLVRDKLLSPVEAVSKISSNPAAILKVPSGSLRKGTPADLTMIDPEAKYTINVNSFASKSRNCPFHGLEVQGRSVLTFFEGRISYSAS